MAVVRPEQLNEMGGADIAADNINTLIQRVAGQSIAEIERLIAELTSLRDTLHSEGERVQREISGYASLSQDAITSTMIITDSLGQWKPSSQQQKP